MVRISKKRKVINEKFVLGKVYSFDEAVKILKETPAKFVESFDVSIVLGIDAGKSEQTVRSAVVLPSGTGKKVRVAVCTQGEQVEKAKAAGADLVGFEDFAETVKKGEINFDVLIATPDAMRLVGTLGQILGPKGLMPNPKVGTVTQDVATAVKNAKSGQVHYRADKGGIVHCAIGKLNFTDDALKANLKTLLADLNKVRPAGVKGIYLKKVVVSSTMGPGLMIDQASL